MDATASFCVRGATCGPGNVVELSPGKSLVLPAPARLLLLLRVNKSVTAGIGNRERVTGGAELRGFVFHDSLFRILHSRLAAATSKARGQKPPGLFRHPGECRDPS